MKNIFKKIVITILRIEAQCVLWRYRPKIVAVTGTVGKTSAKDAISRALSGSLHVRKNQKSLNSEIGVPLAILGLETAWNNPFRWLWNILFGALKIIWSPNYPKWLVLEVGVDRPGDMQKTASWLRPSVAVITAFGRVPVHVEYFESPEDVMREKARMLNYLRPEGVIILNADDDVVFKIKNHAQNQVVTFGKENIASDILASNYSVVYEDGYPSGISFKVNYKGKVIPAQVKGVIGEQFIYPVLAALSTAIALELPVVAACEALTKFHAPPGRMNLLRGVNGTTIIDDSYNASPIAMQKAVEALASVDVGEGCKKIAILGDMTEIGRFSASEHRKIGALISKLEINELVTVGRSSELISEEAIGCGLPKSRVHHFASLKDVLDAPIVDEILQNSNVILVKGSQAMRTEKIVKKLMLESRRAKELLVRQDAEWLRR